MVIVAVAAQGGVGEALVMAQVEVGLGAVVEDVDLAVLVGAHGAGIDVDVGIELLQADAQAAVLQQHADGGTGQPLAQGADHAAGDEDVLGHELEIRHCLANATSPRNQPMGSCSDLARPGVSREPAELSVRGISSADGNVASGLACRLLRPPTLPALAGTLATKRW